jgi:hypothetical protein
MANSSPSVTKGKIITCYRPASFTTAQGWYVRGGFVMYWIVFLAAVLAPLGQVLHVDVAYA